MKGAEIDPVSKSPPKPLLILILVILVAWVGCGFLVYQFLVLEIKELSSNLGLKRVELEQLNYNVMNFEYFADDYRKVAPQAARFEGVVFEEKDAIVFIRKLEGIAEAEQIKHTGLAEAEAMLKKAQSWEKYNQAAIFEMYLRALPELAKAVSEPLSKVDKIVVVGGDGGVGTSKITAQVAEILSQMPEVVKSLTGVDLKKYLKERLSPKEKEEK